MKFVPNLLIFLLILAAFQPACQAKEGGKRRRHEGSLQDHEGKSHPRKPVASALLASSPDKRNKESVGKPIVKPAVDSGHTKKKHVGRPEGNSALHKAGRHRKNKNRNTLNQGYLDSVCPLFGTLVNMLLSVMQTIPGLARYIPMLNQLIDCSGSGGSSSNKTTLTTRASNGTTIITNSTTLSGTNTTLSSSSSASTTGPLTNTTIAATNGTTSVGTSSTAANGTTLAG